MPYGLPSGIGLIEEIRNILSSKNQIFDSFGFDNIKRSEFSRALINSQTPSIDLFLERRQNFINIGKLAIFLSINKNEKHSKVILPAGRRVGIYPYLYYQLISECKSISENNISFITFNYDRSLEYYLYHSWLAHSGYEPAQVAEEISKVRILHVHGSLGKLLRQDSNGLPYSPQKASEPAYYQHFLKLSKNIKIMADSKDNDSVFEESKKILIASENIIFIGFGYHSENLQRLGINQLGIYDRDNMPAGYIRKRSVRQFRGSTYKLMKAEIDEIRNRWGIYIPEDSNQFKGLEFIRKHVPLS